MKYQSGNALWFILIAIGLLGLLTITFSRSSKNNDSGDFEQNQIAASEILRYAKSVENAVQSLLAKGCSENEISFENTSTVVSYNNSNSPSDNSCHVFSSRGAGLDISKVNEQALDKNYVGSSSYLDHIFSGHVRVLDVGTTREEMLLYIGYINLGTCEALNRSVGISVSPNVDGFNSTSAFTGSFGSPTSQIGEEDTQLAGQRTFCSRSSATAHYYFAHVLHVR